ncbi:DUF2335 domain-containing protein [Moraxella bovis]|uniref:DUF2335 domain-containing protein n=1 Tax=Moraxella bovis TaxID=476 RepID=UPI0022269A72|nr:DUF2335 domain-containing protein [Moraxella bovis]UYZ94448.1 DUF2335 domain-containing protein [Moraxella bovis]
MSEVPKIDSESVETTLSVTAMEIQTPFLPPQYLAEYERIVEGSAKQMFDMVVAQQNFNMELKRQEIEFNQKNLQRAIDVDNANIAEQKRDSNIKVRGQIFSFILSLFLIALSAWFAYLGYIWLASIPIGIIIGVITALFLQKRHIEPPSNQ